MNNPASDVSPTTNKREFWSSHVEQWKEGNLSQQAYCRQAGINYATFVYWRNARLSKSPKENKKKFIAVKVATPSATEIPRAIQIKLLNGHVAYIPLSIGTNEIAKLLQLLGNADA
jgi:hypothetical protein